MEALGGVGRVENEKCGDNHALGGFNTIALE
jgi:hypothetical protein